MSNQMSFVGTIGRDAEVKFLASGSAVLNVSVACNTGYGDNKKTMWVRVALFGKRAEGSLKDYLVKGSQVFVSGELTLNEYTGNDGIAKTSLELTANIIDLVGKKQDSTQQASAPQQTRTPAKDNFPSDSDIPF